MAAFDAAQVTSAVRELAAKHEQLHERLSRSMGPIDNYHQMTSPELAAYGLKKMGVAVPADDEHPAIAKLEGFLQGRSGGSMGAGMDSDDNFITRYINSQEGNST